MYKLPATIFLLIIFFLSSCAPTLPHSSEYVTIATLESLSPPQSIFGYPAQVTDGKLLLSVQEYQPRCYRLGTPRKLRFTFTNLTNKSITFVSDLNIAMNRRGEGGNIGVFITDNNGKDLYTLGDSSMADYFFSPSTIYTEIQPNASKDFLLDFYFPSLFSDPKSKDYPVTEPVSGTYYFRFLYKAYDEGVDNWRGFISSNNVEICLSI